MKNWKAMTGLETAMTAECSAGGCGAVMAEERAAGGCRIWYADWGRSIVTVILMAGLLLKVFFFFGMAPFTQPNADAEMDVNDILADAGFVNGSVSGYKEYVTAYKPVYPEAEIRAGVEACVRYVENDVEVPPVFYRDYEELSGDGIYTRAGSLTEFVVNADVEGFYHIALEYYPVMESGADIVRSILIDGELPYREMNRVKFDRVWRAETEEKKWIVSDCSDSMGYLDEPLTVYLTEGEHRISLFASKEPLLIHQVIFRNEKTAQEYVQVKAFWDAVGIKAAKGQTVRIEAENAVSASSKQLCPAQEGEGTIAVAKQRTGFAGGEGWKEAGQWIEWEFNVEEAGYYHILLCDCQNYVKEISVGRKIMIDGTIPFAEMENYHFGYGRDWREDVLSDEAGIPYVFYLKQGHHRIRMEAVPGDVADMIGEVWDNVFRFDQACGQIKGSASENGGAGEEAGQEISLKDLRNEMVDARMNINNVIGELQEMTGRRSDGVQALRALRSSLDDILDDGAYSARNAETFETSLRAFRNWADAAASQPLAIDYIDIVPATEKIR